MSCDNCSDHNSIVLDVLEEIRDQSYTEEDESDGLEVNLLGWDWIDKAFLVAEVAAAYVVAVYRSDGRCDSAHTAGLIAAWRHQEDSDVDATETRIFAAVRQNWTTSLLWVDIP